MQATSDLLATIQSVQAFFAIALPLAGLCIAVTSAAILALIVTSAKR